jgi:uncharacterized protein
MIKPTELKITTSILIFGIAVLAKFVLFVLLILMIKYFYHSLPVDLYSVFNLVSSLIIDTLIIIIILPWFNVGVLEQFRKVQFYLLVMFALIAVLISLLIIPIVDPIEFIKKLSHQQLTIEKFDFALLTTPKIHEIIYFFLMVIITPVVEEIIYRGFLFNMILKKYSFKIALIASSLIFALIHLKFTGIGFLFLYGLFFGYAYYKTKSLITPILAHFTINFLASFSINSVVDLNSGSLIKYLLIYITSLFLVFILHSIINKKEVLLIPDNKE